MPQRFVTSVILLISFCIFGCSSRQQEPANAITILEMNLSAFGVEADNFPSIHAYIDFRNDSSECQKTYFERKTQPPAYKLSHEEIKKIFELLHGADLNNLKSKYTASATDLPKSTIKIYKGKQTIFIEDYGLIGDKPLQEIYKIVYEL